MSTYTELGNYVNKGRFIKVNQSNVYVTFSVVRIELTLQYFFISTIYFLLKYHKVTWYTWQKGNSFISHHADIGQSEFNIFYSNDIIKLEFCSLRVKILSDLISTFLWFNVLMAFVYAVLYKPENKLGVY